MNTTREIEEQEMTLKALYHQREMEAKQPAEAGATMCGTRRHGPQWIDDVVSYHAPGPDGLIKIANIRIAVSGLLRCIVENCPDSADRSEAIRLARTAMMTANASIVLNGRA